jgi:hypothetical protein
MNCRPVPPLSGGYYRDEPFMRIIEILNAMRRKVMPEIRSIYLKYQCARSTTFLHSAFSGVGAVAPRQVPAAPMSAKKITDVQL